MLSYLAGTSAAAVAAKPTASVPHVEESKIMPFKAHALLSKGRASSAAHGLFKKGGKKGKGKGGKWSNKNFLVMPRGAVSCVFSITDEIPNMNNTEKSSSQVWNHKTNGQISAWLVTSAGGSSTAQKSFTSADIADFSSYASVFDQYRITYVECWLMSRIIPPSTNTINMGTIISVVDYDDSVALGFTAALEYASAQLSSGGMCQYIPFKPHLATAVYGGAFTQFGNVENLWLDCASAGPIYYGLKVVCNTTDAIYDYDLLFRMHLQFRNSH